MLNALERKGLIERRADAKSRRTVRLAVTEAGQLLLRSDPLAKLADSADALGADARELLLDNLLRLLGHLVTREGRRPFGFCRNCRFFRAPAIGGAPYFCALLSEPLTPEDSGAICFEQEPA